MGLDTASEPLAEGAQPGALKASGQGLCVAGRGALEACSSMLSLGGRGTMATAGAVQPRTRFGLVLMVTHACNLRCTYCYTGAKFGRAMPEALGRKAIDRALASLQPGGVLELGFFGGEPCLEAPLVAALCDYGHEQAASRQITVLPGLTTNGTLTTADAWSLLRRPDLGVAVSHDGLPEMHNRHRRFANGAGSSAQVTRTIHRMCLAGKDFRVVMVVRPDTLAMLSSGVRFLRALGVRSVDASLDLWTHWTGQDVRRLEAAVSRCARVWCDGLPQFSMSWFDQKAAQLAGVPLTETARCGFGLGEVAVAPSGNLYPCERLIGEDGPSNPMRLPGHVTEGGDFLSAQPPPACRRVACRGCSIRWACDTDCRCSNYVRTGCVDRPDGLLCALNRACARETAKVLAALGRRSER